MGNRLPTEGLLVLLFASSVCTAGAAENATPPDFYVSPTGADNNPGTKSKPFATIAKARDAVRKKIAAGLTGNVAVLLRGGTYELKEPLVFGPEDSGTATFSITYAAAPGEKPVLSGGCKITGWKKSEGDVWTAQAPGVQEGKWYFHQLWVNGQRAVRARTPNRNNKASYWQLQGATLSGDLKSRTYTLTPDQLKQWQNLGDVEAVVFGNWEITRQRFQSVDSATGVAQMTGPHAKHNEQITAGSWCYLENAIEFLDQPGEWYLDRQTGLLSYWPRPGEDIAKADVVAPLLMRLLEIEGTPEKPIRNLHFKGLEFAHTDWTFPAGGYLGIQACHFTAGTAWDRVAWGRMDAAIRWDYAEGCSFRDGAIAHLGGCGIELVTRCVKNVIEGNRLFDISGNGVMLGGPTEEAGVPKDCRIANNHIHACGIDYYGAVGIWTGFAQRTVIAHNEVHDLPYTGISLGWQWDPKPTAAQENTIESNHIYDVMNRLADGGCIYTLGFQPGTLIRGNYLHDVHRSAYAQGGAPNNGIFVDEGSKGFHFERNVIFNTSGEPVRFNQCARDWHTWNDNVEGEVTLRAAGKIGTALSCDGTTTFIEAPHYPALDPENLTVEAWIRLSELPPGDDKRRWIVNKNGGEWTEGHYALLIIGDRAGAYLNIGGGRENEWHAWSREGALTLNAWHHLAMTYDSADLKVYLDGVQVASTAVNKKRKPGSAPVAIGRRQDAFVYFKGAIDEARIYARALSAEELKGHFEKPAKIEESKAEKGLAGYWGFDDLPNSADIVKEVAATAGPEPEYRKWLLQEDDQKPQ